MAAKKEGEQPEWDQTFEPVMKLLLGKKGVKTKSASEVGKKKVDFFRGKDFKKFMLDNPALLKKKCQPALDEVFPPDGKTPADDKEAERIGDELIQRGFCYKAAYAPLIKKDKIPKWPDRLGRTPQQKFDCEGYYVITYDGGGGMKHFLLALIIAGILLACMFPVWPMWAKVGVWYLSVIFLSLYFGVLILRMVVYTAFWIIGFDFWIYPNINDEYCGFLDSFKPFYSWDKRSDDALMLLVRFVSLAITAVAVQQIAETHSMHDVYDFVESSYVDLLDWGVDKLTMALPNAEKAMLPSVDDLEKEYAADNGTGEEDTLKVDDPKVSGEDDDDDAGEEVEVK